VIGVAAANGGKKSGGFFRLLFVLMMITMVVTISVAAGWNPWPAVSDFLDKLTRLSDPKPVWTVRLGGKPDVAAVFNNGRVVAASSGFVEGYQTSDGKLVWHKNAYWAFPAVDVVVARLRPDNPDKVANPNRGYAVLSPVTGDVLWSDPDSIATWVFAQDVVDLVCPNDAQCILRDRDHVSGAYKWQLSVPPALKVLRGGNPRLATARDPAGWFADAAVGTPGPIPPIMPIVAEDRIYLVDTFAGKLLRDLTAPDRQTRVAYIGDRQIFSRSVRADSGCRYTVEVSDAATGTSVWREDGFDLDTARGAGCEPREDPIGAGGRLVVTGTDARPILVEADHEARTWTGPPGSRVLSTDGLLAVTVAPDRQSITIVDAAVPDGRTVWSGKIGADPDAMLTSNLVILRSRESGQLLVLRRGSMAEALKISTKNDLIGYGRDGILIFSARSIGYQPLKFQAG